MDPINLNDLLVSLHDDGFRLEEKGSGITNGTQLEVRFELSPEEWITKTVEFEREPRSWAHPFRRSMFIYTGQRPLRVLVRLAAGEDLAQRPRTNQSSWFGDDNFTSYPHSSHSSWRQTDYFPTHSEPQFVPGGGQFGGAGAGGDWNAPTASSESTAQATSEPLIPAATSANSDSPTNSTASADSAGSDESDCSEPNAY